MNNNNIFQNIYYHARDWLANNIIHSHETTTLATLSGTYNCQLHFCRLNAKASLHRAIMNFRSIKFRYAGQSFLPHHSWFLAKTSDRAASKYLLRYSRRHIRLWHMARSFSVYTVKLISGLRKQNWQLFRNFKSDVFKMIVV